MCCKIMIYQFNISPPPSSYAGKIWGRQVGEGSTKCMPHYFLFRDGTEVIVRR
jgi:hypothetical protein